MWVMGPYLFRMLFPGDVKGLNPFSPSKSDHEIKQSCQCDDKPETHDNRDQVEEKIDVSGER